MKITTITTQEHYSLIILLPQHYHIIVEPRFAERKIREMLTSNLMRSNGVDYIKHVENDVCTHFYSEIKQSKFRFEFVVVGNLVC